MIVFTGTTISVTLPVASTLQVGFYFILVNSGAGVMTIKTSAGTSKATPAAKVWGFCVCILASGTTTASWYWMPGSVGA
jgi:hypothetical protein